MRSRLNDRLGGEAASHGPSSRIGDEFEASCLSVFWCQFSFSFSGGCTGRPGTFWSSWPRHATSLDLGWRGCAGLEIVLPRHRSWALSGSFPSCLRVALAARQGWSSGVGRELSLAVLARGGDLLHPPPAASRCSSSAVACWVFFLPLWGVCASLELWVVVGQCIRFCRTSPATVSPPQWLCFS